MAFANLFSKLSGVREEVRKHPEADKTNRNDTEPPIGGKKRKFEPEKPNPQMKRRCPQRDHQPETTSETFKVPHTRPRHHQEQHRDNFIRGMRNAQPDIRHFKGQPNRTKDDPSMDGNQKTGKKKKKKKKKKNNNNSNNLRENRATNGNHRRNDRRQFSQKERTDRNPPTQVRKRFMTEEFKEQNAIEVDGRLLCRHFLWGRCTKADTCQLEHVQGYNDLLKEVCKFYVQGFCYKGENCPYMHKSFPCKFFHRWGKCSQQDNCKFSHEPLTDVTAKLLEEVIKQDEIREQASRSQSSQEPATTDESDVISTNVHTEIPAVPVRHSFYNSSHAEKDTSACQGEENGGDPPPPHNLSSGVADKEEPVCYSVEAVLGPQLTVPLPSAFGSQDSLFNSEKSSPAESTSDSINSTVAPYSVDVILKSYKSATFAQTALQTASYNPTSTSNEAMYTPTHPENRTPMVSSKSEMRICENEMLKSSPPPRVCATGDATNNLHLRVSRADKACETPPKRPVPFKTHLSVLAPQISSLTKPLSSSIGLRKLNNKPAASVATVGNPIQTELSSCSNHAVKRDAQTPTHLKKMQSSAEGSESSPGSSAGSDKVTKTPFSGLFASLTRRERSGFHSKEAPESLRGFNKLETSAVPDPAVKRDVQTTPQNIQPGPKRDSEGSESFEGAYVGCEKIPKTPFSNSSHRQTPASDSKKDQMCSQGSSKPKPSAKIKDNKTSHSSFLSLFASAPTEASTSPLYTPPRAAGSAFSDHTQEFAEDTTALRKHQAFDLESPRQHALTKDAREGSHCEHVSEKKQEDTLTQSLEADPLQNTREEQSEVEKLNTVSPKGCEGKKREQSVLKSLFVSLGPYREDPEQRDNHQRDPAESKPGGSGEECGSSRHEDDGTSEQERISETQTPSSGSEAELHPPSQHSPCHSPLKRTAVSNMLGNTPQQVRSCFAHTVPPAAKLQHSTHLRAKQTCPAPFKDLFKSLSSSMFNKSS